MSITRKNNLNKRPIVLLLLMLLVVGCQKDINPGKIALFKSYFPAKIGSYIVYDVVDIKFDVSVDTNRYQLKEVVDSLLSDNGDETRYKIVRYYRPGVFDKWQVKDVWTCRISYEGAFKTEENKTYLKMVFPVIIGKKWNGNAFLPDVEWEYSYATVHEPLTIDSLTFDSTVLVNQRANFNLVEYEKAFEEYAVNVGLVRKELIDLTISDFDSSKISKGIKFYQKIVDYGYE